MNTLLLSVLLQFSSPAAAQPSYTVQAPEETRPTTLPEGRRCTSVEDGQEYWCATPDEFVDLLLLEEEAIYWWETTWVSHAVIEALDLSVRELTLALSSAEEHVSLLLEENTRLFEKWKNENRLRHDAEATGVWDVVPWMLTAVEAAVILGGALVLAL